jgi:hypothetical protein
MLRSLLRFSLLASFACLVGSAALSAESAPGGSGAAASDLRPPSAFASVRDKKQRSVALFTEAAKVIQGPRCLNCHPAQRIPTQGDDLHAHVPYMEGGPGDRGVKGLPCASCHGQENVATLSDKIQTVPGNPHWGLAPASMAWQGKSLGEICNQIKDPNRNGGFTLARLHSHMAEDHLVGWAWHPGEGRTPAPGTQAEFGALIQAWIDTGAHCPTS